MERVKTGELKPSSKHTRNFMERNASMKVFLKIIGVLGVSLVMSGMWGANVAMRRSDEVFKMEFLRRLSLCLGLFKGKLWSCITICWARC